MKVLVLGGTGAMGVHLVQMLSNNGIETVVTSRKVQSSDKNIHYIQGNARDMEFLLTVLKERWDAIVDFMVYSTSEFEDRIEILLSATTQYVYLSSARVYADSEQPITEDSPRLLDVSQDKDFLSTDEYSLTKARQEDILRNSGRNNWTIIRPYITYSENRLQLGVLEKEEWLYRALKGRSIVFSEEMCSKITTLTYGLDVAKGIMSMIGNVNSIGKAFHITAEKSYTWVYVLDIYLDVLQKHLGYRPKVLLQNFEIFHKIHPAIYQIKYDRFFNRQFDNSNIAKLTNIKGFKSIEEGLRNCLEEFLKNPVFNTIDFYKEALKDRQANEFTSLKETRGFKKRMRYLMHRYL